MTPEIARERVARGAAYLDQVRPGWAHRIDLDTLTLHDPCGCIVGQVCGTAYFLQGVALLNPRLGAIEGVQEWTRAMGFDASTDDLEARGGWVQSVWRCLQDAWVEAIAARVVPTPTLVEI